ncbi:hypothetical protein [Acinetobacter sp.]|uniref:hypothetical protein n=1 Tax=Acinetobacter sp. TaxID=472 RepID=UPI000C0BA56F|nr:hypothetical protein [Acinetobacter sp.]MAK32188.1 hypothetical protein [Acinetobacter sp.]
MAEFAAVLKEAAPAYLKGRADNTIRNRLLLTLLAKNGRIKYNASSHKLYWDVKAGQRVIEAYGDDGVINFQRSDLHEQLNIDWRGYKMSDRMTEKQRLMLGDLTAIIDRYSGVAEDMMDDLQDGFCGELFVDGYATGNENRLHGLDSFLGYSTAAAADRVAQPNDTYGGHSTAVATRGGTWSTTSAITAPNATIATDWPDGNGSADYDWNSPKLVNFASSNWGTGSTTWADNCERVLAQTTIWTTLTGGKKGRPTIYLLSGDLFYDYQNKMRAKYRIQVPHSEANDLGFSDTLNQDGVMIQADFDVPAGVGYGLNINQMCLESLDNVLFSSRGPEYDINTDGYLWLIGFFGNARYNPKHFSKLKDFTV